MQSASRGFMALQKEYDNVCSAMDIVGFLEQVGRFFNISSLMISFF